MYRAVAVTDVCASKPHNISLEAQITAKIKVFVWYLIRGVVLTKDNLENVATPT